MAGNLNKIRIESISKNIKEDLVFTLQRAISYNRMGSTIYPTKVQDMFLLYSLIRRLIGDGVDSFLFKFATNEVGTVFFTVTGENLRTMLLRHNINFYKDYKFGDTQLLVIRDLKLKKWNFEKVKD